MIEEIVWLSEGESPQCFAGSGLAGPWGETVEVALATYFDQSGCDRDSDLYTRVIDDTLFVSDWEF